MKRILSFIIAICLVLCSFSNIVYASDTIEKEVNYGDVDVNYIIDAADALAVLKHAAKLHIINESLQKKADVDGNDVIDAVDALEILKYAAAIIDIFPVEENAEPTPTPMITMIPDDSTPTPDVEMPDDFSGTVWIMGDSIAAYHSKSGIKPLYGWGEVIGEYFSPVINFRNHAISSQSTSSYYTLQSTTYGFVFEFMKENDYVIISYGHNDHNEALLNGFDRTTDPDASSDTKYSYKWWLKNYYIDPVLEKGAVPILMSPVVRCRYKDDVFYEDDIHMKYGKAMEELVAEYAKEGIKVYYIDAQDYTYNLYSTLTFDEAWEFHGDYTHFCKAGAEMICKYIVYELAKTDLSIVDFINEVPEIAIKETPTPEPTLVPDITDTPEPTATPEPTDTGDTDMKNEFSGNVWILGDSIAAQHEKTATVRPLYGWGELIGEYFTDDVTFINKAISSQSTSSYYYLQRTTYDSVFDNVSAGDYVIISYGHNDHNTAKLNGFDRTTDPEGSSDTRYSYKWWLKNYYIDPALEKGATPILMSSIVRCTFKNGEFYEEDIHMKFGKAMEELIAEYKEQGITVYYIDAQDYTYNLYSTLTYEEAKLFHGQYGSNAGNYFDNTHFSEAGARMIIDYMISELKKTDLSIVDYIKE